MDAAAPLRSAVQESVTTRGWGTFVITPSLRCIKLRDTALLSFKRLDFKIRLFKKQKNKKKKSPSPPDVCVCSVVKCNVLNGLSAGKTRGKLSLTPGLFLRFCSMNPHYISRNLAASLCCCFPFPPSPPKHERMSNLQKWFHHRTLRLPQYGPRHLMHGASFIPPSGRFVSVVSVCSPALATYRPPAP